MTEIFITEYEAVTSKVDLEKILKGIDSAYLTESEQEALAHIKLDIRSAMENEQARNLIIELFYDHGEYEFQHSHYPELEELNKAKHMQFLSIVPKGEEEVFFNE